MARRPNPTMTELVDQYEETGVMPPELGGSVQTSASRRPAKRRGKVKVPKIGDWKRTPKQRGCKQGYQWKPPAAWRPPSEHFYIFPAPNKRSQGATRFFYVTDGTQVLSTQHRTKSEAVKALKGVLSGAEAKLRVNYPNPLTRDETAEVREWERFERTKARQHHDNAMRLEEAEDFDNSAESHIISDVHDARAAAFHRVAQRHGATRRRPNPPALEVTPPTDVYGEDDNPVTEREQHTLAWRARGEIQRALEAPEPVRRGMHAGKAMMAHEVVRDFSERRPNADAAGMPGSVVPYMTDYRTEREVIDAWYGGKDFLIQDISSRWDNKPMSIRDVPDGWSGLIQVRYNGLFDTFYYTGQPRPNPLTDVEVEEVHALADEAEATKGRTAWPESMYHRGKEDAYSHVVSDFDEVTRDEHGVRRKPVRPRRGKKAKKKKRRKNPSAVTAAGEVLSFPQKRALRKLHELGKCMERVGLNLGQKSTLAALHRRGLVTEIKKGWKINAAGRKALGLGGAGRKARRSNPKLKSTMRKATKRASKRLVKKSAGVCKFTIPLERGRKGAKCAISYPRAIFKNREEALRNVQRELRAKFKQLKKAPTITSCAWKYSDQAKTKGRWHFTAKKAG